MKTTLRKIRGKVRDYAWGGYDFIPKLLGQEPPRDAPSAEYWLGAHPNDPATIDNDEGQAIGLDDFQNENGEPALPFLMKILDVRMMLSIQVHPSKERAIAGFEEEEATDTPRDAPTRNYKDDNHKPELMVALSEFWMLHGLRSEADLEAEFAARPSCAALLPILKSDGLTGLVALAVSDTDPLALSINEKLIAEARTSNASSQKSSPDFWICRWLDENPGVERGILMILLMNIVRLEEGEAIYQPDGLIHAYLEGQNIEIMANSDNVLRAGLTNKHIDASELLRISKLDATKPETFKVEAPQDALRIRNFDTPFDDFHLRELELPAESAAAFPCERSSIVLAYSGERFEASNGENAIDLKTGDSCYASAGSQLKLSNPSARPARVFIGS